MYFFAFSASIAPKILLDWLIKFNDTIKCTSLLSLQALPLRYYLATSRKLLEDIHLPQGIEQVPLERQYKSTIITVMM